MSALPQQASPSPEIVPALDENRPTFGPNLAGDPDFCKVVLEYWWRQHLYPAILQQQTLHRVWREIDNAWRVKGAAYDLDISSVDPITAVTNPDGRGRGGIVDGKDGYSARIFPPTFHQQIVSKTNSHMAIGWGDGFPVHADAQDDDEPEHPLYQPIQNSVNAQNKLLKQGAEAVNLKKQDRKGRGSFCKYGHAWVATDYVQEFGDQPQSFRLMPGQEQQALAALAPRFGGQQPQITQDAYGYVATWTQKTVLKMQTNFIPLRVDDVFVDQTLPADEGLKHQLCVSVRTRTNRASLFGNDYDGDNRPFGWLNTQQACQDGNPQWSFMGQSNTIFQEELTKKWGLSIPGMTPIRNQTKSRWTGYVMLGIYQDPKTGKLALDDGSGVTCPECDGHGTVQTQAAQMDEMGQPVAVAPETHTCPTCEGRNKLWIPPERYVVEAYGDLESSNASATCLRIQRNPTPKDRVPVLYSACLTEDTAGAIPLSKSEAALKAVRQEATAMNYWFDMMNGAINPPWIVPEAMGFTNMDLNRPNRNIEGVPNQFQCMRPALDFTQSIMPWVQANQDQEAQILNMSPQLLGEINQGRRSATELQNAFDAGQVPILQEIDQYGEDILGGWGTMHLESIEAFADRDWIQQETGRTTFGRVKLVASVGDAFLKRQTMMQNYQWLLQALAARPDANIQPLLANLFRLMKIPVNPNEVMPDGGVKKAAADAIKIVTQILGNGQMLPAMPDDPHAIYIEVFTQAMRDPYWQEHTPENMPLLQFRIQQQTMFQIQEQQAQLAAQQHAMAMQQPPAKDGGSKGAANPAKGRQQPQTSGQANQQAFGAMQS